MVILRARGHLFRAQVKPLLKTAGITLLMGAIGSTFSVLAFGVFRFLPQELVISLCTSFFFFVSATFFKAQDDY